MRSPHVTWVSLGVPLHHLRWFSRSWASVEVPQCQLGSLEIPTCHLGVTSGPFMSLEVLLYHVGSTKCHLGTPHVTWVSLQVSHHLVSLEVPLCHPRSPNVTWYHLRTPSVTWVSLGVPPMSLVVTWCPSMSLEVLSRHLGSLYITGGGLEGLGCHLRSPCVT